MPDRSQEERQTRHFFIAWAMATLFHQASFMRLAHGPLETLLSLAAVAVLLSPGRSLPFISLLVIQVVEIAWRAPEVSNHWWLSLFVALTLLLTLIPARRGGFSLARWREYFLVPLRALLIIVYVFSVFHKLNTDFLDPEISCGVELYRTLASEYLPFLPQNRMTAWLSITGTLAVETAIPALLIWPRTRAWGVLLGVAFHFFLAFVPYSVYYNFSSALFALFLLFTPTQDEESLRRLGPPKLRPAHVRSVALVALLVFFATAAYQGGKNRELWRHLHRIPWAVYGGWCVFMALQILARRRKGGGQGSGASWRPASIWTLVLPLLFVVNGASPYLGLKTETSLAMYSNLRTEGGSTNHLLIPTALDPFDRTQRIVKIKSSSNKKLRRLGKSKRGLLWFEFRDYLARHPNTRVVFQFEGKVERLNRAGDDERFSSPESAWVRKLVYFRPVDLNPDKRCSH